MQSESGIELNGKRILLVEDEFIVAAAIKRELEELGATVLGPAPTPFYALQLIGSKERRKLDAAVLDVHLHRSNVFEVADALRERGVPFIFATGYAPDAVPDRFTDEVILQKPIKPQVLRSAIMKIMRQSIRIDTPMPISRPRPLDTAEPPVVVFARSLARALGRQDTPIDSGEDINSSAPPVTPSDERA